jgi:hypothetical protein
MTTKRHQPMPASARAPVQRCVPDADLTARFMHEVVSLRERLCRHTFGSPTTAMRRRILCRKPC